jgi:hypothetical protein
MYSTEYKYILCTFATYVRAVCVVCTYDNSRGQRRNTAFRQANKRPDWSGASRMAPCGPPPRPSKGAVPGFRAGAFALRFCDVSCGVPAPLRLTATTSQPHLGAGCDRASGAGSRSGCANVNGLDNLSKTRLFRLCKESSATKLRESRWKQGLQNMLRLAARTLSTWAFFLIRSAFLPDITAGFQH